MSSAVGSWYSGLSWGFYRLVGWIGGWLLISSVAFPYYASRIMGLLKNDVSFGAINQQSHINLSSSSLIWTMQR
jgi:hypothetical protein